jgi:hypothetical protein
MIAHSLKATVGKKNSSEESAPPFLLSSEFIFVSFVFKDGTLGEKEMKTVRC